MATTGKSPSGGRSRKPKQNLDQLDLWGQPIRKSAGESANGSPDMDETSADEGLEIGNVVIPAAPVAAIATVAAIVESSEQRAPMVYLPPAATIIGRPPATNGGSRSVRGNGATRPAQSTVVSPISGAHSTPALTRRQIDLLAYLKHRAQRGDNPPSLPEICRDLGLSSRGSLHKQVVALVQAGLVEPMNGKQRGVRLIEAANDDERVVPLLGAIAAGRPIEALFHGETLALPGWLKTAPNCFALRVRGDSMRDAGILDGDVVIVEARTAARDGETVVALVNGEEATLKRIEQRPDAVLLHSANPTYQPMRFEPGQVQVQGIVVAQIRKY